MSKDVKEKRNRSILVRVFVCLAILVLAGVGFVGLKSLKKPPVQKIQNERPLKVEVTTAAISSSEVLLNGHGELKSLRVVELAAQVAGEVTHVHPNLKDGQVIEKGELLFAIEDIDYRTDYEINKERLHILERDLVLTKRELDRVNILFEKNKVGTKSGVETTEKQVNNAADRVAQVRHAMTKAKINLDRCEIRAPFTCRVVTSSVEVGQYLSPGKIILSIADDSILEVEVPLYGREALEWLLFEESPSGKVENWFATPQQVPCDIRWAAGGEHVYKGILHRVTEYSSNTRSLKVVVRVNNNESVVVPPLVAGMFVSVDIPGKIMVDVIELPRIAVSFENDVFTVKDGRLHTTPVEVVRVQDGKVYVGAGLQEGDKIITTRLVNPLEGSKVEILNVGGDSSL